MRAGDISQMFALLGDAVRQWFDVYKDRFTQPKIWTNLATRRTFALDACLQEVMAKVRCDSALDFHPTVPADHKSVDVLGTNRQVVFAGSSWLNCPWREPGMLGPVPTRMDPWRETEGDDSPSRAFDITVCLPDLYQMCFENRVPIAKAVQTMARFTKHAAIVGVVNEPALGIAPGFCSPPPGEDALVFPMGFLIQHFESVEKIPYSKGVLYICSNPKARPGSPW